MSESDKMDGDQPARLFISYSHKDEGMAKELLTHLKVLVDSGTVCVWYDRMIEPAAVVCKSVATLGPVRGRGPSLAMGGAGATAEAICTPLPLACTV